MKDITNRQRKYLMATIRTLGAQKNNQRKIPAPFYDCNLIEK